MTIEISAEYARLFMHEELTHFASARDLGDQQAAWRCLERIHIVSQSFGLMHLHSHWLMLRYAWALKNGREVVGQLVRLMLAPAGNLTGRLPIGNTGRSNVSAFAPMEIPEDISSQITKH